MTSGLLLLLLLFGDDAVALLGLLIKQWLDADTASLGPEVAAEGVCTRKSTTAAPVTASRKVTAADELFLARMETLVAFAVVLSGEGFTTDCAHERSFVGVSAKM